MDIIIYIIQKIVLKELFFMFGNDNSTIQTLNYSFSNIEIYTPDKNLNKIKILMI